MSGDEREVGEEGEEDVGDGIHCVFVRRMKVVCTM